MVTLVLSAFLAAIVTIATVKLIPDFYPSTIVLLKQNKISENPILVFSLMGGSQ